MAEAIDTGEAEEREAREAEAREASARERERGRGKRSKEKREGERGKRSTWLSQGTHPIRAIGYWKYIGKIVARENVTFPDTVN